MQIPNRIFSLTIRALTESMDVKVMTHIARDIIRGYDLYERTGFRMSMVVPQQDAARQIVQDMRRSGKFLYFISLLIQMHTTGYVGRVYNIKYLKEIITLINSDMGYIYDMENRLFVENSSLRCTKNWGALLEGGEYIITFLRIDIAENSRLVRKYQNKQVQTAYKELRAIVEKAVLKRNGRIWHWEGDGGLAAFFFGNKNLLATLSGMEIINELYVYNLLHCRLPEPLKVRVAVHAGHCEYTQNTEHLLKQDSIKDTIKIESKYTLPGTMTISREIGLKLDASIMKGFEKNLSGENMKLHTYSIKMES